MRRTLTIALAFCLLTAVRGASGAVLFVDAQATGANNGSSWTDAYTNLQTALAAASSETDLWIAKGTYYPGATRASSFQVKANVNFYGGFTNGMAAFDERDPLLHETMLSGDIGVAGVKTDNSYQVVTATTNAILDGLVIAYGNANGTAPANTGGGLYFSYASPQVRNCLVISNDASSSGGGASLNRSAAAFSNCVFRDNLRTAVYDLYSTGSRYENCRFIRNDNGVYVYQRTSGTTLLSNCVFAANTGYGMNGTYNANFYATHCLFSGNGSAGAVANQAVPTFETCHFCGNNSAFSTINRGHAVLRHCVMAGNVATIDNGGAVLVTSGTDCAPVFLNCTVAKNRTSFRGGALAAIDQSSVGINQANPIFRNCILWGNSAALGGDEIYANNTFGGCSVFSYSNVRGGIPGAAITGAVSALGGILNTDPLFAPPVAGTWSASGTFDTVRGLTLLTDTAANWTNSLRGQFLNPGTNQYRQFIVFSNTPTTLLVWGDAGSIGSNAAPYLLQDYHLQSTQGRWTPDGWVVDATSSPCLNMGSPLDAYANEPLPNGNQINMGAFGGTAEASQLADTTPPQPPASFQTVPGDARIALSWSNSLSPDSVGVLLVRRAGAVPSAAPAAGIAYAEGDPLGDGDVVLSRTTALAALARGWTNAPLVNGTHYFYTLYAFDAGLLYSAGVPGNTTPSASAGVSPIYVDGSASGANNGTSWVDAFTGLRNALATATNRVQLWVAGGVYLPGEPYNETFAIKAGVEVYGGFSSVMTNLAERDWASYPTVLDANIGDPAVRADNSDRLATLAAGAVLDGFIVTNGYGPDGALYLNAGTATVRNCTFVNNDSGAYSQSCHPVFSNCVFRGGISGLYNYASIPKIYRCLFYANSSYGLRSESSSAPVVEDSVFAANGGGAYYYTGAGVFTRCVFSGNTISGLSLNNASPRVEASLFCGNTRAGYGGAINGYNRASAVVRNSLFAGNRATGGGIDGGALGFETLCVPYISNCTVVANAAADTGGGFHLYNLNDTSVITGRIVNCIFRGNTAPNGGAEISHSGSGCQNKTLHVSWSDVAGGVPGPFVTNIATHATVTIADGGGLLAADPLFAPVRSGTWRTNGGYDPGRGQTVMTDTGAAWAAGELLGAVVNPFTNQVLRFAVFTNDATTVTVWGNAAAVSSNGFAYAIEDYHLQSRWGRWTALGRVTDASASPCIDAGATNSPFALEPAPNGGRINMGAYGNTAEASMTRPVMKGTIMIVR